MNIAGFRALLAPEGQRLLGALTAADVGEDELLGTASRLRAGHSADLVSAALTQVRLRARARAKFGADADQMYFTATGLEQATRRSVAEHRAARFAARLDGAPVLEPGCGIGADLVARARAGLGGRAVEIDPLTAAVAAANLAALAPGVDAHVVEGDAADHLASTEHRALFADPARRTARGRVFDPRHYLPPLDLVLAAAGRAAAGCVKVAPGIPYDVVPAGAEAEWVSVGGDVKEAAIWLGELAGDVPRRATLLPADRPGARGGVPVTLVPRPGLAEPEPRGWGRYLYEPDGAVIRAGLVAEAASEIGAAPVDRRIGYLTGDAPVTTPYAAAYEIEDVLPFSLKRLRAELRRRRVTVLTLKKRGSAVDLDRLRRDLGFGGGRKSAHGRAEGIALTVVLTRIGDVPQALLTRPLPAALPECDESAAGAAPRDSS